MAFRDAGIGWDKIGRLPPEFCCRPEEEIPEPLGGCQGIGQGSDPGALEHPRRSRMERGVPRTWPVAGRRGGAIVDSGMAARVNGMNEGEMGAREWTVRECSDLQDEAWDAWLEKEPHGQFQQTAGWASAKAVEGWRPLRLILEEGGEPVAGFQVLWRRGRLGRIGYVSKGPVLGAAAGAAGRRLIELMRRTVGGLRCRALVVQPPDSAQSLDRALDDASFLPNHLVGVIDATLVVALSRDPGGIEAGLSRSVLRDVRLGGRRGLSVLEGDESHLGEFFRLMKQTCDRQKVQPNPRSEEHLRALWRGFAGQGRIRLTFVRMGDELVSGGLSVLHGKRWTHWKRGWSGRHATLCPNTFLIVELMRMAARSGFDEFDFASLRRPTAEAMLRGAAWTNLELSSRDRFHLGFGGRAVLLPRSKLWIPHPLLRAVYRCWRGASGKGE